MSARVSLSERAYGALLRLLPADLRREYGGDMRELFRDHLRAARRRAGLRGVAMLWLRSIPDLFFTGFLEHEDEMLQATLQDARYAIRILKKSPAFALVGVLVVALGTGAVSTIFSVANAIVLRPIPAVARPGELMTIERVRADGGKSRSASYPYYTQIAHGSKAMSGILAWDMIPITISTGGDGMIAQANLVTGNYFDVLGVHPAMGRLLGPADDREVDGNPVVVISHELWQRRFGGDSSVLGKKVLINGRPFTIIGVAAERFSGLMPIVRTDAWVPMAMQSAVRRGTDLLHSAGSGWLDVVGRVAPGVKPEAARAELTALTKQYAASVETGALRDMAEFTDVRLTKVSGLPADAATPVLAFFAVLLAVGGLVLLIASVNVASMLLARAVVRRREIAVRLALGAARGRLVRQLLTESVILFGFGGALGVVFAVYGTRLLARLPLPIDVPLAIDATPDARVIAVTLALALLTGVVFGLAPALQGTRGNLGSALRGDGVDRSRSRLRNALVAGQMAASLLLLTTAGLFVRALSRGHSTDPGYEISHTATATFDVSLSGYDSARARAFYAALRDRVRGLPGVTAVAYTRVLPLSMNNFGWSIAVPGETPTGLARKSSNGNLVAGDYFDVLRLPIDAGRTLLPTDDERAPRVAVVSRAFADTYWPGQSALGRTFKIDSSGAITVVGVTRDVKFARLDEPTRPFVYMPLAQHWRSDVTLLVRTSGDPANMLAPIRAEARALDPTLPPPVVATLERAASVVLLPQRFAVIVTAALGIVGLLLAVIGLYGVVSFSTAQRTREIGVRMALGAARGDVVRLIVRDGMRVVQYGVIAGLVLTLLGGRVLAPFLFGVDPLDAPTFLGTTALLAFMTFVASVLPARRAAAADPMTALRQD